MPLNDLTADMLTRIRNAVSNRARQVMVLDNKLNRGVAKVLHEEGYIRSFEFVDVTGTPPMLAVIGRSSVSDGVGKADAEAPGVAQAETVFDEPPEKETLVE